MLENLSEYLDDYGHSTGHGIGNADGTHDDEQYRRGNNHAPSHIVSHVTSHPTAFTGVALGLLQAVLNQVDYGLAVVDADTRQLLYANALAMDALRPDSGQNSGLRQVQGQVCARQPGHAAPLALALARTKARLRGLLRLAADNLTAASGNGGSDDSTVAVMPLFDLAQPVAAATRLAGASPASTAESATDSAANSANASIEPSLALLVFPKRQLCDTTTLTLFARDSGLTGTEGLVLAMVCKGLRPSEIATSHGVQVCTVRSQLRSIRQKTASDSLRELVEKVSVLPSMARQLQHVA